MMSAKILIYAISDDETVANLQLRIEKDTNIPAAHQELLLEAGLVLEPNALASQSAVDYMVTTSYKQSVASNLETVTHYFAFLQEVDGRRTDYTLVFLFDCSSCTYEPQFSPRILPENIRFIRKYTAANSACFGLQKGPGTSSGCPCTMRNANSYQVILFLFLLQISYHS